MPPSLVYPGVYIYEIASGVKTIVGVSTSVTAFVGAAKRGKINKAVHILSFSDYERLFGGLYPDTSMSYAVRQFFLNGGSDAWVVRITKGAIKANKILKDANGNDVLSITAIDEGKEGNAIDLIIDYNTTNPASTFNLTFDFTSPDNPSDTTIETYQNLSMNSRDPRYVVDMIKDISRLVDVQRVVGNNVLSNLGTGESISGKLVDSSGLKLMDVAKLYSPNHNQFQISINGLQPVPVILSPGDVNNGLTEEERLKNLCTAIRDKIRNAANGNLELQKFDCVPGIDPNGTYDKTIVMTSGVAGEASSVHILQGERNDISARLRMGAQGGVETDGAAKIRPAEKPDHGTITSGVISPQNITDLNASIKALPSHDSLLIGLDGYAPDLINLGTQAINGINLDEQLSDLASRIMNAVRQKKRSSPAYNGFAAVVDTANDKIILSSGTRGAGSSVVVNQVQGNNDAALTQFLNSAKAEPATDLSLQGGDEQPFKIDEAYNLFIADRSKRQGIYALEEVDIFNILCLPGITDPGILQDATAYCQERRAFMIIDSQQSAREPEDMLATLNVLPKSNYAAVYYPWIGIADPLKKGKITGFPPSGTIAGLFARIDASRGVWKAPAGVEATLVGAQKVERILTDLENGTLNPHGINCIRSFPVAGVVSWGARTLLGDDQRGDEYKYIPIRRLALYIEESLFRGLKWVVFEPNDEPLWAQIRLNVGAFMHSLFRQGAFQGIAPKEAYFVKCDKETTTQDDINKGIVNIVVGFAPLKPAEFVVIKIQQMAGQIQT